MQEVFNEIFGGLAPNMPGVNMPGVDGACSCPRCGGADSRYVNRYGEYSEYKGYAGPKPQKPSKKTKFADVTPTEPVDAGGASIN
jgi:hypothetical protein